MAPAVSNTKATPARRRLNLATSLAAIVLALTPVLGTGPVLAQGGINDLISGGGTAGGGETATGGAQQPGGAVATPGTGAAATDGSAVTPPTGDGTQGGTTLRAEAWIVSKNPMDHLKVIAAAPLDGETCQNVIFDARPYLPTRFEPRAGGQLNFSMNNLCLVGFRNDSDKRRLVIRLGENFSTLAITADPQLFTGLEIAPGQQVLVALRPLPVSSLDIGLEAVWEDELDSLSPKVERATITVTR
ncbi:MAG: hypothetical protein GC150_02745 [Rhizobiales bacterium]|nr:hypothetical protein [Hyphomicrobiales bacterium]